MNKLFKILSTVLVVGLASLGLGTAAFADNIIKKNENTVQYLLNGYTDWESLRTLEVSLQESSNGPYYTVGKDFDLKVNGDTMNPVLTKGADGLYDTTKLKKTDVLSIVLYGVQPKNVHAGYFTFSNSSPSRYQEIGGFQTRSYFAWYDSTSEEDRNSFFKVKLLGEVEVKEIPTVVMKNLVDGGILSVALIIFASLLVAGLVVRYLHSLRSLR